MGLSKSIVTCFSRAVVNLCVIPYPLIDLLVYDLYTLTEEEIRIV